MGRSKFRRVSDDFQPDNAVGEHKSIIMADSGFYWEYRHNKWIGRGLLQQVGRRLLDVQAKPTIKEGYPGDVGITPQAHYWKRMPDEWEYCSCLIYQEPEDLTVQNFRCDGNLSVPVVGGFVFLYDRDGKLYGKIKVLPIDISESEYVSS